MAPMTSRAALELPWAERHRPKHLGQVVGNTDQVRKLAEWLRDWDDVVLKGKTKVQQVEEWRTYKPVAENINARAALITGPPGIGKTTTCTLVARCNRKYNLMEFNASDARSKAIIDSMSNALAGNHTLKLGSGGKSSIERTVIIMDECDGMAGGGDKGGMQALINMIKVTKNPVICICNDRGDKDVRNLAPHCFDIKFRKPENKVVAKRVKGILEGEGRKAELSLIEAVVESCGHDIRQVLNHVQFYGSTPVGSAKDTQVMLSPFDACIRLLSSEPGKPPTPLEKKLDMFYIDADFVPLMIQENYLRPFERRGGAVEEEELARCATAAELISIADTMSGNWELMSSAAVVGSIYPAYLASSGDALARPTFPTWLMKRSNMSKGEKLLQELHAKVKVATTCSCRGLVTSDYHDLLHMKLLRPLQIGAVKECAAALVAYGLNREFFTDQAPALRQPLQLEDGYKTKVEGKLKHQLLQEIQALQQEQHPTAVKRKRDEEPGAGGRRRHGRGGEDGGVDAAEGDGNEEAVAEDGGPGRGGKQRSSVKAGKGRGKASKASDSRSSLAKWKTPTQQQQEQACEAADRPSERKPMLVLKYLDGHTNAVRRTVHMQDVLGPWLMF